MRFTDIQAAITTLDSYAEYLKAIRASTVRLIHQREMGPEALSRIAWIKDHLEQAFEAGIDISETLLKELPRLLAHPAQLAGVLEAQARFGDESDQIMIILDRFDPTLADPNATRH